MRFCSKCGKEIMEEAVICVHCGCEVERKTGNTAEEDSPSASMAALGFFFPFVGFILFLVWKDSKPQRSSSAGKGALLGVLTSVAVYFLFIIISLLAAAG